MERILDFRNSIASSANEYMEQISLHYLRKMLSKIILIEKGSRCLPASKAYFRIQGAKIALTAFLEMIVDSNGNSVHETDGSPCSLRIRQTEFVWWKAINLSCSKYIESIKNNIEI